HFEVGAYNPGATLVIDPVLTYSEWMGGNWDDIGRAIKTDASGAIYLAGDTGSRVADGMYMSAYAFDTTYNGPPPGPVYGTGDIFVRKIANNYVYSTYLGGTGNDFVKDLAVDAYGCVYLTGYTLSSNFPVTPYAYRTHYAGNGSHPLGDAFVTRLNPSGSGLVFSTFLGGAGDDRGNALSLDGYGNVYVIGETNSTNLPVKGAYQDHLINTTPFGGISNAFLASFRSNGVARYVTYFGSNDAIGTGIAVDQVGNTFIGGMNGQVPTTPDVYCPSEPAGTRSWVSRFNSSGSTLAYSTYLPGCSVSGLGNDGKGNIYVTGTVNSFAEANGFVTTPGAYQSTYGGGESDIFVTKLHAGAGSLAYSTYLGGSGTYEISSGSIAVDKRFGSVAVAGGTFSDDFPIYNPLAGQYAHNGGYEDGFVTRLLPSGEGVTFSTFLGGNLEDRVNDVSMDGQGVIYVTGWTTSTDFPIVGSDVKLKLKDVFVSRIVSAPIFVQFAQLHVSAPETVGVVTLNLERNTTSGTTRVHFTTQDGTAVAGEDYEGKSGVVTFLPGQTTKAIAVRVFNDSLVEGTESFYVSLSSPSGAILGMNTEAEIQIRDNDLFPSLAAPAMTSRDNVLLTVATSNNLEESALSTVAADGWASQVNGSSLLLPPTRTGEVVESAGPSTRNNVESPTTVVTFERPAIPPKFTSPIVTTTVRMPAGPTVVGVSDGGWTNPVWVDVF
ncbi:MAG: SBBP repeat-containing protein, partial [Gemmataceae bacterium]